MEPYLKKTNSVMNDGQKIRFNAGKWNQRMENQWLLILHGVQLGGRNQEAEFCHEQWSKVRVLAGEWKTTGYCYSMECNLGGGIKKLNSVMNDGQKVRVHAGEWNHMLKD